MAENENSSTKQEVISKHRLSSNDCGSPEVQIALLTQRLQSLTGHFAKFPQDLHSQRGMLRLISRRKNLLSYLEKTNVSRYRAILAALGLRK